jgi:hypothetical protein
LQLGWEGRGNWNGVLGEWMIGNVGMLSGKHNHILLVLLAHSGNRNDVLCTDRRGDFGRFFNRIVDVAIGGMWRGNINSRGGTTKDVDGCSPVSVAGTVVVEEDLVKRDLDRWLRDTELVVGIVLVKVGAE